MYISGQTLFTALAGADGTNSTVATDTKWTVASLIITSVVSPILLWFIGKKASRTPQIFVESQPENPEIISSAGQPLSTANVSDEMMRLLSDVWHRLSELEKREDEWQKERREIIDHNKLLLKVNVQLGTGLSTLVQWIDSGAAPPPPEVSTEIRQMVEQIMEQIRNEANSSDSSIG